MFSIVTKSLSLHSTLYNPNVKICLKLKIIFNSQNVCVRCILILLSRQKNGVFQKFLELFPVENIRRKLWFVAVKPFHSRPVSRSGVSAADRNTDEMFWNRIHEGQLFVLQFRVSGESPVVVL
jgi:hypothetical protein